MIKNIKNINTAKEILILHHTKIKESVNKDVKIELKKLKKTSNRQNKKNLKKYLLE